MNSLRFILLGSCLSRWAQYQRYATGNKVIIYLFKSLFITYLSINYSLSNDMPGSKRCRFSPITVGFSISGDRLVSFSDGLKVNKKPEILHMGTYMLVCNR